MSYTPSDVFNNARTVLAKKGSWSEGEHPRDDDGKFTDSSKGGDRSSKQKRVKQATKSMSAKSTLKRIASVLGSVVSAAVIGAVIAQEAGLIDLKNTGSNRVLTPDTSYPKDRGAKSATSSLSWEERSASAARNLGSPHKPKASGTTASVPFMITRDMKQQLFDRGYKRADVDKLTPAEARRILSKRAVGSVDLDRFTEAQASKLLPYVIDKLSDRQLDKLLISLNGSLAKKGSWSEGEHPRDDNGKFTDSGAGESTPKTPAKKPKVKKPKSKPGDNKKKSVRTYASNKELPQFVRSILSDDLQTKYRELFNEVANKGKSMYQAHMSAKDKTYPKQWSIANKVLAKAEKTLCEFYKKLDSDASVEEYIDDFTRSSNSRFKGKSKRDRVRMALGAYYNKVLAKAGKVGNPWRDDDTGRFTSGPGISSGLPGGGSGGSSRSAASLNTEGDLNAYINEQRKLKEQLTRDGLADEATFAAIDNEIGTAQLKVRAIRALRDPETAARNLHAQQQRQEQSRNKFTLKDNPTWTNAQYAEAARKAKAAREAEANRIQQQYKYGHDTPFGFGGWGYQQVLTDVDHRNNLRFHTVPPSDWRRTIAANAYRASKWAENVETVADSIASITGINSPTLSITAGVAEALKSMASGLHFASRAKDAKSLKASIDTATGAVGRFNDAYPQLYAVAPAETKARLLAAKAYVDKTSDQIRTALPNYTASMSQPAIRTAFFATGGKITNPASRSAERQKAATEALTAAHRIKYGNNPVFGTSSKKPNYQATTVNYYANLFGDKR